MSERDVHGLHVGVGGHGWVVGVGKLALVSNGEFAARDIFCRIPAWPCNVEEWHAWAVHA